MLTVGFIRNGLSNLRIGFREGEGHPSVLHNKNLKAFSAWQSSVQQLSFPRIIFMQIASGSLEILTVALWSDPPYLQFLMLAFPGFKGYAGASQTQHE